MASEAFSVITFCHSLRNEILRSAPDDQQVLVRFVVDDQTTPDTVRFEVVLIGKAIIPFIMDASDFTDISNATAFILSALAFNQA